MHGRILMGGAGSGGEGGGGGIALIEGSAGASSVSKSDWKYREMLILQYISSIKVFLCNWVFVWSVIKILQITICFLLQSSCR